MRRRIRGTCGMIAAALGAVLLVGACSSVEIRDAPGTAQPDITPTPMLDADEVANEPVEYSMQGGNQEIYLTDLSGERLQRLTSDQARNAAPAWSPDGELIAWVKLEDQGGGNGLYIADAEGGDEELVADYARARGVDWSPDGDRIAFVSAHETDSGRDEVHVVDLETGEIEQVTFWEQIPTPKQYMGSTYPTWSPDGERLAVVVDQLDAPNQIHIVDLESDEPARQLTDSRDQPKADLAWSPDGERIAYGARPPHSASPRIMIVDVDDGNPQPIQRGDSLADLQPDWSPDGSEIAFTAVGDSGREIWVAASDGTDRRPVTDDGAGNASPAWSPVDDRILLTSERDTRMARRCSFHSEALLGSQPDLEDLAWSSHIVVVGSISEKHDPAWAEPLNPPQQDCLTIWTDFTVEIDTQLRGAPAETVRLRVPGGTIGEHTQTHEPSSELEEGNQVLLFLRKGHDLELLPAAYAAGVQRSWKIEGDRLESTGPYTEYDGASLPEVLDTVRDALASGEPVDPPQGYVPPKVSPIPE